MTKPRQGATVPETRNSCTLNPSDQEKRFAEFAEVAAAALLEARRTAHGARLLLRHSSSVQTSLWRLIEAERRCCSFLEFGVEVSDDGILVDVTGPPAARLLIDRLFELELAAGASE